ncbi:hypothetical protein [Methyloversatilis sp.]|uniref:hypothetical protein n=1 Tax=Methyloversatilis sp. TaxID=2569862 RepID=UPI002735524F|nr:hypothetical protein [Methyloversatilis sp.]MDP2867645.1 hypothetical protein [Methyloversatilis sp.]MDP3456699.1 hypothetical protein [Methyloversatilis sp.]MDP3577209.1 hypothetical protein [Methyloversatilis sp.]
MPSIDLTSLFAGQMEFASDRDWKSSDFNRLDYATDSDVYFLIDSFSDSPAVCAFIRCTSSGTFRLSLEGEYCLAKCAAGGWILKPYRVTDDFFWLPAPPMSRSLDQQGHILSHKPALVSGAEVSPKSVSLEFENTDTNVVDIVAWKLPEYLLADLQQLDHMERRSYFLWSSHTAYKIPADVYLHLVNGHVYENHEVWPKYWRVCSELDAYALYVTLSGLLRGTGKKIYELMRRQIVFSVVARQNSDGGWYHGEWTDEMESHYRLHAAGMLLLAAYFEEIQDPVVGEAIKRACAFAATRIDRINAGVWYLHDSLEETEETLKRYPFRYEISRALGKSPSNLMVLNTHLDTNVAMERCRRVTGDAEFSSLIESARETSVAVCAMKPAEWLYRPLFRAIGLTLLPPSAGAALPLPLRAIKRMTWKYIIPLLPRIKARFPRFVMPGGFIERDLAQHSFSVRYQPVNLMDLVRTRRIFGEEALDPLLEESFAFTQHSGIKERWKEFAGKEDDSLGFWAEALYHMCLLEDDRRYRAWLADAVIYLDDARLGLSPSLLGCNAEAVAPKLQTLCPRPSDPRLCVTNLSKSPQLLEYLVINPSREDVVLEWELAPVGPVEWLDSGDTRREEKRIMVPARGWVQGVTASQVEVER